MNHDQLDQAAAEWLRLDQNPTTRSEIEGLVSSKDYNELSARFSTRIAFGTAGLRAKMAAGTAYMNDLVVIQATQGLVRYAAEHVEGAKERGIVIGYDHRAVEGMSSERFAQLAGNVARQEGWRVYAFEGLVHTPMVPFATTKLNAALGLMITASHNPAADNGYKVYWSNSVQIIPPHDDGIAARISQSLDVARSVWDLSSTAPAWDGTEDMKRQYLEMAASLATRREDNAASNLVFTYTAMHGVGLPFATAAFESFGSRKESFSVVQEQAQPDPRFPTVRFPNPEEKGALDLAIAHADRAGSIIVLANDPDADRFCAAEKVEGTWKVFTGDQLGTLLGAWVLAKYKESGAPIEKLAMCASTVSSKMLRTVAKKEGFVFRDTLTGFKYLGNEVLKLAEEGYAPLFAYEEAIGYLHGEVVRDKDGVTALVSFCEMAVALKKEGKTISAHLDSLYDRYGFFTTSNSYFICRDPAKTDKIFTTLRFGDTPSSSHSRDSLKLPTTLAGFPITYLRDLTVGFDSSNPPSFEPNLPIDPKTHMISFAVGSTVSGDGVEVTGTVRTSGTEPKIKFYLEGSGADRRLVESKLAQVREALGTEWLRWEEFGLERA
ncbi:hypothetical protein BCR35DRAFT_320944 [Leucosporidium creatinivorum]|uniref:Phosphoglucomutase 1 n=1 Tax=Leucosporidium creatinivorum TaxID=106004 RepID=A0A1Y2FTR0_9BASI|nr:hypothetical protein BCR35DRAFT_320944 [Leucosporidium creatinivorum]